MEVFIDTNDTSESGRNPDNNESEFCGGRRSVTFYKLKRQRQRQQGDSNAVTLRKLGCS